MPLNDEQLVRFSRALWEELKKPYELGGSDCFSLLAAGVRAIRGEFLDAKLLDSYSCRISSVRVLRREGFSDLSGYLLDRFEPVEILRATTGDPVVLNLNGLDHFGFCVGSRFVTKLEQGRVQLTSDRVLAAVRV